MQKTEPVTNQVTVIGQIAGTPAYSHTVLGEDFYTMDLTCPRLSGYRDTIPVTVPGRMLDMPADPAGRTVCVRGTFCSRNHRDADRTRVILSVLAREIGFMDGNGTDPRTNNQIFLDGYICRMPVYRKTPMGRQITDLLLAVNRSCKRTDYIPCIVWGRGARYAGELSVGTRVTVQGRIQSRGYIKRMKDGTEKERTAFEVSVSSLEPAGQFGETEEGTWQG